MELLNLVRAPDGPLRHSLLHYRRRGYGSLLAAPTPPHSSLLEQEDADDLSSRASYVGPARATHDYVASCLDTYEPHPGDMAPFAPTYSPYRPEPPVPIPSELHTLPIEPDPEPESVEPRYMYLTDKLFEEALEEISLPASNPMIGHVSGVAGSLERPEGALPHEAPTQAPVKDDPLEQLLMWIGPLGPGMM